MAAQVREGSITERFVKAATAAARSEAACHPDGLVHGLVPPHQRCSPAENLVVIAEISDLLQILVAVKQFRPEYRLIVTQQDSFTHHENLPVCSVRRPTRCIQMTFPYFRYSRRLSYYLVRSRRRNK